MRCERTTENLIEMTYKCALGLTSWQSLCEQMREALPGTGVALHGHQIDGSNNVGVVEAGFDTETFPAYVGHYMNLNPWIGGLERSPVGAIVHSNDVVPEKTLLRTEFWNDWLKPQGDYAAGSALILSRAFDRNCAVLTNYFHKSHAMRQAADRLLREVGPHIQHAFGLWCRSVVDRERVEVYQGCLDTLPTSMIIVDGQRKTRMVNQEAEAILRRNDGLLLGANRELRAHVPCADKGLGCAVANAATRSRPAAPIMIERRCGDRPAGHYIVSAFLAPNPRVDMESGNFTIHDGKLVVLAVNDTSAQLRLDPHVLSDAFGLPATEAELSCFMLNGASLAEYAKLRCVLRHTVRKQFCSIMHKTGTRRQAELICRLTRTALAGTHSSDRLKHPLLQPEPWPRPDCGQLGLVAGSAKVGNRLSWHRNAFGPAARGMCHGVRSVCTTGGGHPANQKRGKSIGTALWMATSLGGASRVA